jgi:hypothetical protein
METATGPTEAGFGPFETEKFSVLPLVHGDLFAYREPKKLPGVFVADIFHQRL